MNAILGGKTLVTTEAGAPAPALSVGHQWIRNSAANPVIYGGSVETTRHGMTAFLQTNGMERAIMPGGWLVGKLDVAVIQPAFALPNPNYSPAYTLADIKAANPGMKVLAYVNGAIVHAAGKDDGVFQSTADMNYVHDQGWLVPVPDATKWTGADHAAKAQDFPGDSAKKYVGYVDFAGFYLTRIDQKGYRDAFVTYAQKILGTASKSTQGAPDAYFDGIALDDTNMSPQHGIELPTADSMADAAKNAAPEVYGPWTSNAAYGQSMVEFADYVAHALKTGYTRGSTPTILCNIGANPWTYSHRKLALDLASRRVAGGPAMDHMLREFSDSWFNGSGPFDPWQVESIAHFGADLAEHGVCLGLDSYAVPPAAANGAPTAAERAAWEKKQRMVFGIALLAGNPSTQVQPCPQVANVHEKRNQWSNTTMAEKMGDKVASLDTALAARFLQGPRVLNRPTGPLTRDGNVLWRTLEQGTVYVNVSDSDATVNGVTVPARDAVIA